MTDPFELFQIEPRFDLDLKELERRHRELSRALHPDRYVGRPKGERRLALNRAIAVNEAWRTLRDPMGRANALLVRLHAQVPEGSEPPASPEFLMEMMERREMLRELGQKGDLVALEKLSHEVRAEERRVLAELAEGFRQALDGGAPPNLVLLLGELRYLRRFLDEADEITC